MAEWEECGAQAHRGERLKVYSCAGICCSISRQALIFKRRQTQHSGSAAAMVVSAPHTEHLAAFLRRSGETATLRLFEDFGLALLVRVWLRLAFHYFPSAIYFHYGRCACRTQEAICSAATRSSCRFGNLYHRGNVQRRTATRTFLAGGHARILAAQVDFGRHRVRANRAMRQSLCMTFS